MHSLAACLAALFAAQTAVAQTSPVPEGQPVKAGFALQTSLVAAPIVLSGGLPGLFGGFPSFEGGLFAGYKYERVIFGVGFDFTNWSESKTNSTFDPITMQDITFEETQRSFTFIVYPEVQVALIRSADARAELLGAFSVGFGTWNTITTRDPDPFPNPTPARDELRLRARWRVGPGVRYWVHPHVAMNLVTGVSGNHMIVDGQTPAQSSSLGLTALYTQIGLAGVF
jgi:hypothetical protein